MSDKITYRPSPTALLNPCMDPVLKEISKDELEWKHQTDEVMMENDRISFLAYAEEECLKRGMKQGEIKKAIEIAKKMIENNIPLEMIKITTGLSDEEINKLV